MPPSGSAYVIQSAHTGSSHWMTCLIENSLILHLKIPIGGRRWWTGGLNTCQGEVALSAIEINEDFKVRHDVHDMMKYLCCAVPSACGAGH